jgi:hypothetical protein
VRFLLVSSSPFVNILVYFRDVWCMATKERLWILPLETMTIEIKKGTSPNVAVEQSHSNIHYLNVPFSFSIADDMVVTESTSDKAIFILTTTINHETIDSVSNKKFLQDIQVRKEIFKGKDRETTKRWFSFLSYQNISNQRVQSTKKISYNNKIIENDNDLFHLFEEEITEIQKAVSQKELQQYQEINSFPGLLFHR